MARIRIVLVLLLAALVVPAPAGATDCVGRVVVLVHDFASTPASMAPLERLLARSGRCVVVPSYGMYRPGLPLGGMRSIEDSAPELAQVILDAAQRSGARVDVVAHGAGSLVAQRAVAAAPAAVRTLISLGGAWRGTNVALLGDLDLLSRMLGTYPLVLAIERQLMDGSCAVCREVIANSDYLRALEERGALVRGVRMVNIVTRYDELVVPYTSGTAAGMENLVLQDARADALVEHFGLPVSPVVGGLVGEILGR